MTESQTWSTSADDNRLSEFQQVKTGIVAGRHLEKRRNRSQGFPESRVICGLGIPRGYDIFLEGR